MFLFGWGLEFLGWCIGWCILGIISSIFNLKKLIVVILWLLFFRLNLEYRWIDGNSLKGVIHLMSLPIIFIIFGYNYKED